jgi:histidine decarboxylase
MKRIIAITLVLVLGSAATFSPVFAETRKYDKTAVSPFNDYCDGYGMPGAKGQGYISVLKVSTGVTEKTDDLLLDGIVTYDKAEATDAYIGQINMITASSFNGLIGSIWGYDLAVAEEIRNNSQKPMFAMKQYDGSTLPVFDAAPLLKAGQALFGTEKARRFPPVPGGQIICANKSAVSYRPAKGKPNPDKGEAYGVWAYLSISIAKDRSRAASLFIEDAGTWTKNDREEDMVKFLKEHQKNVAKTTVDCGRNQSVLYDRIYMAYAYVMMKPGQAGTALTVAPYVTLAKKALPGGDFTELEKMSLKEWEKSMGF